MNRQQRSSVVRKFAMLALLVCTSAALGQQPVSRSRPVVAAGAEARSDRGLPIENADDRKDREARFGRRHYVPLPANAPQPSPDPRNFEGVWYHDDPLVYYMGSDMFGNPLPFTPEGRKVTQRRVDGIKNGKPYINASAYCIPMGQLWQMDLNMPFQIYQTKDRLEMLFQEFHGLITISMDPAKAPPPGYMGRSIGHWDGDTLVVETSGFKEDMWLTTRGSSASKNTKLTQRIRKVKAGDTWYLEMIYTIDDPSYYTQPWSFIRRYNWHPDLALFSEYNCELQVGAKDGLDPSLLPEPQD